MSAIFADNPDHIQVLEALRAVGARIYAGLDLHYAEEVHSTLQAMGVSRQAGIRRLIASGAPLYQRIIRRSGASMFVTDAELHQLFNLLDGTL